MTPEEKKLRELLYRAIMELDYVQEAPVLEFCASAKGRAIIKEGMELLGVKDLSAETLESESLGDA